MSSTYHLKRIEVTNDWAINQISFVYDDGQTWSIGNKRGTKDLKEVILDIGEYLVRVTHEKYYQVHLFRNLFTKDLKCISNLKSVSMN